MLKNVKCARCVKCGKEYEAVPNLTNCSCGGILDIIYDYDYIKSHFTKETLKNRVNPTMWRYRELLPIEETTPDTPLRVGWSPLYEEPKLAELLGLKRLWVKDDGINPTASLKDRASAMAVAKAGEAGAKIIACSSTGNAASSLAGNAAAAGFKTYIFVPERAPKGKVAQLMIFGANVISVKGNYEETFKMSAEAIEKWGWYNRNAAINPYLSEGKKTVALEIAEQLNWEMPDYLAISVGDGCTIAGVWKGLKDLYAIGFIDKLPRLISAQSTGCYPLNRAIQENKPWEPMEENTIADSISVGVPRTAAYTSGRSFCSPARRSSAVQSSGASVSAHSRPSRAADMQLSSASLTVISTSLLGYQIHHADLRAITYARHARIAREPGRDDERHAAVDRKLPLIVLREKSLCRRNETADQRDADHAAVRVAAEKDLPRPALTRIVEQKALRHMQQHDAGYIRRADGLLHRIVELGAAIDVPKMAAAAADAHGRTAERRLHPAVVEHGRPGRGHGVKQLRAVRLHVGDLMIAGRKEHRRDLTEAAQELIQPLQLLWRCIAVNKIADAEDRIRLLLRHAREQRRVVLAVFAAVQVTEHDVMV